MSNHVPKGSVGAAPGQVGATTHEVLRAEDAAMRAREAVTAEESRLAAGADGVRLLEAARQDLDAAEAFEQAVENSQI